MIHDIEQGTLFLGFGPQTHCDRCGNSSNWPIRVFYLRQKIMFIPAHPDMLKKPYILCGICEGGKTKLSDDETSNMLFEGQQHTRNWYLSQSKESKAKFLETLAKKKQFNLIKYLNDL